MRCQIARRGSSCTTMRRTMRRTQVTCGSARCVQLDSTKTWAARALARSASVAGTARTAPSSVRRKAVKGRRNAPLGGGGAFWISAQSWEGHPCIATTVLPGALGPSPPTGGRMASVCARRCCRAAWAHPRLVALEVRCALCALRASTRRRRGKRGAIAISRLPMGHWRPQRPSPRGHCAPPADSPASRGATCVPAACTRSSETSSGAPAARLGSTKHSLGKRNAKHAKQAGSRRALGRPCVSSKRVLTPCSASKSVLPGSRSCASEASF